MGKRYCFYCRGCELKLTLFDDVCKNSKNKVGNFYCSTCEDITYHGLCRDCNRVAEKIIQIPKNIETGPDSSITIECPRCNGSKTVMAFLGTWE